MDFLDAVVQFPFTIKYQDKLWTATKEDEFHIKITSQSDPSTSLYLVYYKFYLLLERGLATYVPERRDGDLFAEDM